MASQDVRLRFVHDARLRYWHRWEWYGPRLLAFAMLAVLSTAASLTVFLQFAFGATSQRSLANALLVMAVATVWFALFVLYHKVWWIAFVRRVTRLQPAMKAAVNQLVERWPETDVFLPGLGNYGVSCHDPDHLLHADATPVLDLSETVGGISRKQDCCLGFDISSYIVFGVETVRRCQVECRMHGWSPPPTSVIEVRSPPHTRTVQHEYDVSLGGPWYLSFYNTKVEFKDEVDPEILAEIAKRPLTTRLPHRGDRFRALRDIDVDVQTLYSFPGDDQAFPIALDRRSLPTGEVVRLDYEPNPSQSTHCMAIPENHEGLEDRLVESKHKKHRDYAGYRICLSYIELDKDFEWLGGGKRDGAE